MYLKLPAGSDGRPYVVPVEETGRTSGSQTQVTLTGAPPNDHLSWSQWVRNEQLLTDEEAENE